MSDNSETGVVQSERPYRNESLMRRLYQEEQMSTTDIADKFDCSPSTVNKWLNKLGIGTRSLSEAHQVLHGNSPMAVTYLTDARGYEAWRHNDHYIPVHRLVMVAERGFDEVADMHVHHRNEIRWDNRPENLELLTNSEHQIEHQGRDWLDKIRMAEMYEHGDIASRPLGDILGYSGATVLRNHKRFFGDD